jgi:hypothetical protein
LDAPRHHPKPFTEEGLRPYRDAEIPHSQKEVIHRHKVMRAARSTKKRAGLSSTKRRRVEDSSVKNKKT